MIPVFGISIPFIFVLLILLLVKTPKLGAWVVGGLIMALVFGFLIALPIAIHDGLIRNTVSDDTAIPVVGIAVPFLFVLLILLLNKAPKLGAAVIVGVIAMGVFGAFLWIEASNRRVVEADVRYVPMYSVGSDDSQVRQATQSNRGSHVHGDPDRALEMAYPEGSLLRAQRTQSVEEWARIQESFAQSLTGRGAAAEPAVTAPIWSEGVENEYEADIYPSKLAALRALGTPLQEWIQQVVEDINEPPEIVLFQEEHDRSMMWELEQVIEKVLPELRCSIEAGHRNIDWTEIGVTLRLDDGKFEPVPWSKTPGPILARGRMAVKARVREREVTVRRSFIEKPWVEDFAGFASERPERQYLVSRSWETCTSENEAKTQAIRDACDQVSALVGQKWATVPGQAPLTVSSTDLLEGGFIADQFVQSFDGMSGRIWRQAMLIDASAQKLSRLGERKTAAVKVVRMTWARMILSVLGVMIVIVATYLFLNMATKGYYVWSLRIAGVVLAVMGVISILLVLK